MLRIQSDRDAARRGMTPGTTDAPSRAQPERSAIVETVIEPTGFAGLRIRPLKRRLTRDEYDHLVELGIFTTEDRIELLRGVLVEVSPQGSPHAEVVQRLAEWLLPALLGRARVSVQRPFAASRDSEPEPDIAVVPPADYSGAHPNRARLLIEVSDSSIRKDRVLKAAIYAEAGIPEYWVVDVPAERVFVLRRPRRGQYTSVQRVGPSGELSPEKFPDVRIGVGELLRSVSDIAKKTRRRRTKKRQRSGN